MSHYTIISDEIGLDADRVFIRKFLGIDSVIYMQNSAYVSGFVENLHKRCPRSWKREVFPNRLYVHGNIHSPSLTIVKHLSKKVFEQYMLYDLEALNFIIFQEMKDKGTEI